MHIVTSCSVYTCINLTEIGDGHIDCYGGWDERNVLGCSSVEQLGFSFKCNNSDKCIDLKHQCSRDHRCSNKEDRFLCFHYQDYTLLADFTAPFMLGNENVWCFDGSYSSFAKCNGETDCSMGEDELFCPVLHNQFRYYSYRAGIQEEIDVRKRPIVLSNYRFSSSSLSTKPLRNTHNEMIQSPIVRK
jgi:hypothetical protein